MISLSFNTTGMGTQFCLDDGKNKFFLETEFSKHSETFFPLLEKFLNEHNTKIEDVDILGICVGPGSFTGIRIGLSVVKMFSYVLKAKCIQVNALEVLAYNIFDNLKTGDFVCSIINAGSENLYYQVFKKEDNFFSEVTSPRVCSFVQFEKIKQKLDAQYVYYDNNEQKYDFISLNNKKQNFSAKSLGQAISKKIERKQFIPYKNISPLYLRFSQAEQITADGLSIFKASIDNLNDIVELEKNADLDDVAWNEQSIKESFKNQSFGCLMANISGTNVGYISYMDLGDEFEILRIVVAKKARFKGVGIKLLNYLFQLGKESEKTSVVLEVNEFNYSALLLYEKLGFCEVGKRSKYYHNKFDGIIMRKFLEEWW